MRIGMIFLKKLGVCCGLIFTLLVSLFSTGLAQKNARNPVVAPARPYYPSRHDWARRSPAQVGMDSAQLAAAVAYAIAEESPNPRSMEYSHYQSFGREPFGEAIGPFKDRGAPTGVILRHGFLVHTWGEPQRVDMTHSITKSFLSTVVGLAVERGLIRQVEDTVGHSVGPIHPWSPELRFDRAEQWGQSTLLDLFSGPHNRNITWDHLLRQTSGWQGVLWGKPDWADRPSDKPAEWLNAAPPAPGTVYEYNDTRVNVLALAALQIWRQPLPQVLRQYIMDPIGASPTWRWFGYQNSLVLLDGQIVQSVSGGGHWGGGMMISAMDLARFGLLILRQGQWEDQPLLAPAWIKAATTPTPVKKDYGYMNYFLNTDRKLLPSAREDAFMHLGNGTNAIIFLPEKDLLIVVRWVKNNALNGLVERVLQACR